TRLPLEWNLLPTLRGHIMYQKNIDKLVKRSINLTKIGALIVVMSAVQACVFKARPTTVTTTTLEREESYGSNLPMPSNGTPSTDAQMDRMINPTDHHTTVIKRKTVQEIPAATHTHNRLEAKRTESMSRTSK
ncbi:MAG: hypothetical protein V4485_01480, partial [Pseudomonadota bacterium]